MWNHVKNMQGIKDIYFDVVEKRLEIAEEPIYTSESGKRKSEKVERMQQTRDAIHSL